MNKFCNITKFFFYFLSMKKCQDLSYVLQEKNDVMKQHGDKIDHDILVEMDVLYRSIKEALRLHQPLIVLLHNNHKDFSVADWNEKEYIITKGNIVEF